MLNAFKTFIVVEHVFGEDIDAFPEDRLLQTYEQFIVNLRTELDELPPDPTNRDIQYSKVALNYLRVRGIYFSFLSSLYPTVDIS